MRGKKRVSEKLKDKSIARHRMDDTGLDYEDVRIIRKIMRESASSRPDLYVPKGKEWHRFARQPEMSQKSE